MCTYWWSDLVAISLEMLNPTCFIVCVHFIDSVCFIVYCAIVSLLACQLLSFKNKRRWVVKSFHWLYENRQRRVLLCGDDSSRSSRHLHPDGVDPRGNGTRQSGLSEPHQPQWYHSELCCRHRNLWNGEQTHLAICYSIVSFFLYQFFISLAVVWCYFNK